MEALKDGFSDGLSALLEFLPKLIGFLLILVIGYVVAKVLAKVVGKVLEKVGFDKAVEKGGVKKVLDKSQYDASDILAKIVFYAVMLFVLSLAFGVFGTNPISTYLSAIIGYLPKVFVAILIIVIASAIAAGAKLLIQNTLGGLSYGRVLANVASGVILALGIIAALNQLQIAENVVNAVLYASLAALVGVVIVAIGGGGIGPMRQRWESTLAKYDEEKPKLREQVSQAGSPAEAIREEASSYGQNAPSTDTQAQPVYDQSQQQPVYDQSQQQPVYDQSQQQPVPPPPYGQDVPPWTGQDGPDNYGQGYGPPR